jgi:C-terminal processing protease CtpA/Prc
LTDTVAYLRPGAFSNTDPGADPLDAAAFLDFVDSAFQNFLENEALQLIVDLRDNPGGHNAFSDPVIAWFAERRFRFSSDFRVRVSPESTAANQARVESLPESSDSVSHSYAELYASTEDGRIVSFPIPEVEPRSSSRFAGDVYVLVNRYSFSNAVSAAALIQDYGFGVIMGEQTVDMATTYGAMERFTLPNTEIVVAYPKALIIRPNGKESIHPVTPDVVLPAPRIRGASDVMLEAAVRHIESESTR